MSQPPPKKKLPDPVVARGGEKRALREAMTAGARRDPERMRSYYAACTLGLEEVLCRELRDLGAEDVALGRGGASFRGNLEVGYKANLWCRTAVRVQEELATGFVRHPDDLYDLARRIEWSESIHEEGTLAVHAAARDSVFRDGRYAAQIVKDAVVDGFRDRTGVRPDVDRRDPDLPIKAVIRGEDCALYRDLSGQSLHKRGYRPIQVKSPLNEAIAAGLLLLTEWDRKSPLLDPMCGSGTFCIEAAFLAGDRAPGLGRSFAFERWQDLDRALWERIHQDAEERWETGRASIPPIEGNDHHSGAIELSRIAVRNAELSDAIRLHDRPVHDFEPSTPPALVVVNPPYGERIGHGDELGQAWYDLGQFFRRRCGGATAWVLSGDPGLTRDLRMRAEQRIPVANGPIDCRWIHYQILEGRPDANG